MYRAKQLSFPKSAQTIQTMQKNKHLSRVNLSLFKTRPGILKIESANVHFHGKPLCFTQCATWAYLHIHIFTEFPEVPQSADPQFRNTRWSLILSNEVEVEEKKRKWNV